MRRMAFVLVCAAALAFGGCGSASEPVNEFDTMSMQERFMTALEQASSTLEGITDMESAQAALPTLKLTDEELGRAMSQYLDQSTTTQQFISDRGKELVPALQSQVDQVKAIPGVSAVVGPTTDSIMKKLERFF